MNFLLNLIELQTNKFILFFVVFSFILSFIVLFLSLIVATQNPYYEKTSVYECGFEPFEDARNKFEVRFYIVAILFIIFDIEIVYMLP
jgi:NADH-quinone oxidoreductase subunit A